MSVPKRHHYVPSTYLEGFKDSDGRVRCVDFAREKIYLKKPSELAKRKDYNSAELADGTLDRTTIESFYEGFETKYPHILRDIRNCCLDFLGQRDLLVFGALLQMRSPLVRDMLSMLAKRALSSETDNLTEQEHSLLERAKLGGRRENEQLSLMTSGHVFHHTCKMMEGMRFYAILLGGEGRLVTSDNAFFMAGVNQKNPKKWTVGLNHLLNRRLVVFPVSQDILLLGDSLNTNPRQLFTFEIHRLFGATTLQKYANSVILGNSGDQLFSSFPSCLNSKQELCKKARETACLETGNSLKKLFSSFYSQSNAQSL